MPEPDEPALSEYPQFSDDLIESRDVGRHFHRPSMAYAGRRPQSCHGALNCTCRVRWRVLEDFAMPPRTQAETVAPDFRSLFAIAQVSQASSISKIWTT